jgi:hypothetical protein
MNFPNRRSILAAAAALGAAAASTQQHSEPAAARAPTFSGHATASENSKIPISCVRGPQTMARFQICASRLRMLT